MTTGVLGQGEAVYGGVEEASRDDRRAWAGSCPSLSSSRGEANCPSAEGRRAVESFGDRRPCVVELAICVSRGGSLWKGSIKRGVLKPMGVVG